MKRLACTTMLLGLITTLGFGQVNDRRQDQQDRIAQGVQSGQLTPNETSNLENKQRALSGEIRADRSADGGKLTAAEHARVNRQQNRMSNQIYNDKHNTARDHFGNSEVGKREQNQQNRIAQGIRSDRLNAGKTANLEGREAGMKREIKTDRADNGGKLTGAERAQVNRQQNRTSRAIYRSKHR